MNPMGFIGRDSVVVVVVVAATMSEKGSVAPMKQERWVRINLVTSIRAKKREREGKKKAARY